MARSNCAASKQPLTMEVSIVTSKAAALTTFLIVLAAIPAAGGELTLAPVQDNTLYEVQVESPEGNGGPPSNGAGDYFFAGMTNFTSEIRRGLVAFDVAGSVPTGAIISSVSLTLVVSRSNSGATPVELHRVTSDWGEGTSDASDPGGTGAPATDGDATWFHTFYPGSFWSMEGGDFSPTVSATQSVAGNGSYTWDSTPEMVADVQSWLDDPGTNFGWLVLGDESGPTSAKRFNTRENSSGSPQLTIVYQAPVPSVPVGGLIALGLVLAALSSLLLVRKQREAAN